MYEVNFEILGPPNYLMNTMGHRPERAVEMWAMDVAPA